MQPLPFRLLVQDVDLVHGLLVRDDQTTQTARICNNDDVGRAHVLGTEVVLSDRATYNLVVDDLETRMSRFSADVQSTLRMMVGSDFDFALRRDMRSWCNEATRSRSIHALALADWIAARLTDPARNDRRRFVYRHLCSEELGFDGGTVDELVKAVNADPKRDFFEVSSEQVTSVLLDGFRRCELFQSYPPQDEDDLSTSSFYATVRWIPTPRLWGMQRHLAELTSLTRSPTITLDDEAADQLAANSLARFVRQRMAVDRSPGTREFSVTPLGHLAIEAWVLPYKAPPYQPRRRSSDAPVRP